MLYVRSKKEGRNASLGLLPIEEGRGRPAAQGRGGPDVVDGPGGKRAYVTILEGRQPRSHIVSVKR